MIYARFPIVNRVGLFGHQRHRQCFRSPERADDVAKLLDHIENDDKIDENESTLSKKLKIATVHVLLRDPLAQTSRVIDAVRARVRAAFCAETLQFLR